MTIALRQNPQWRREMYEQGMMIEYDPATRQVHVTFRGNRLTLAETFPSHDTAKAAAETYCRDHGWNG